MPIRSIVIFPKFSNLEIIEALRLRHDPLATKIAAHITLVFPFESNISLQDLEDEVRTRLVGLGPFSIELSGFTKYGDEYLFLSVVDGYSQLVEIHDRLYSGILKDFLSKVHEYIPHLTVGRFLSAEALQAAYAEAETMPDRFTTVVTSISVERIIVDDVSQIELNIPI